MKRQPKITTIAVRCAGGPRHSARTILEADSLAVALARYAFGAEWGEFTLTWDNGETYSARFPIGGTNPVSDEIAEYVNGCMLHPMFADEDALLRMLPLVA